MNNEYPNRLECSEFEALLAEALDGALSEENQQSFEEHGQSCPVCSPLWAETQEGLELMRSLGEVDPPQNLVHNILAATSMTQPRAESAKAVPVKGGWLDWLRGGARPSFAGLLHSRFAASFAMAFFSLSITLTLAGVRISDVRNIDWHPSALRKNAVLGFTQMEARVTSYYENLRVVYEVQTKVQALKKKPAPAPDTNNGNKQENRRTAPDDS